MRRIFTLLYGVVSYLVFLGTFLYAIGFVGNWWAAFGWTGPLFRSMDHGGPAVPFGTALLVDLGLLGVFAVQHSVMARAGFKRWWTKLVPEAIERSTYVLAASLALLLLFWQWRPLGATIVWHVRGGAAEALLVAPSMCGWAIVLLSTYLIDHFGLFGLRQVWNAFRGEHTTEPSFRTPLFYKAVRHPLYLGFMIAFWATPFMTLSHLIFAAATTAYMLIAIQLEERDLVARYGEEYLAYRRRVWMLLPLPRA